MANNALNIAKILISFTDTDFGDVITNLKLQKLLYYAQGSSLALNNKKLFNEDIIAWQYGPVVPNVYDEFKTYGKGPIDIKDNSDYTEVDDETLEILDEVYRVFGQYSAIRLMELSHSETPWNITEINSIIDPEIIKKYFKDHYINE